MTARRPALLFSLALAACSSPDAPPSPDASMPVVGSTCSPCTVSSDCIGGACVQYGGDDRCGRTCLSDCASAERCLDATSTEGKQVRGCVPASGACPPFPGCGACASGTTCDPTTATCVPVTGDGGVGSQLCGTLAPPARASCCHSCTPGDSDCQSNGCYGGWWCDTANQPSCYCTRPPGGSCGSSSDGGARFVLDAGFVGTPPTGNVGPTGGTVSKLYFAIVGDSRPGNPDDTAHYPTSIITKIYADLAAMNPPPQFVVATGDYMFASPTSPTANDQMAIYAKAAAQFRNGPLFAAMGNHECTGATASNCSTIMTTNYAAYRKAMVAPLGQTLPYYVVNIGASDTSWTAKLVVVACNAWDPTQSAWLQTTLARPTTYTFVARHEPPGANAPCVNEVDNMLTTASYDMLIVGHTHTYAHSGKQLIVGNGGAPITGGVPYGYATVEQTAAGFLVTQYEYSSAAPVSVYVVP